MTSSRRRRFWRAWATGDAVTILGFTAVIAAPGTVWVPIGLVGIAVGVILIVGGAYGDRR